MKRLIPVAALIASVTVAVSAKTVPDQPKALADIVRERHKETKRL
jgi:hypothetical protein